MLRVPVCGIETGELTLREGTARYVAGVHRAGAGERILLFDPEAGREGIGVVVSVGKGSVVCRVEEVRSAKVDAGRRITLVQGLGKGDKVDAIVRDATELGATAIVAVESARSVVRLGAKGAERLARWRRIAVEAARQSGRGYAPRLSGPISWREAMEGAPSSAVKLCLFEGATDPVGPRLFQLRPGDELVLAVGPEGGLDDAEVQIARDAGFATVSLGPLVLRTETVAAAVLGGVRIVDQILASSRDR